MSITRKKLSDFSIKRVYRLIEEERERSLIRYLKRFLPASSIEKHKTEIEKFVSRLIANEEHPVKKELLKKLEGWST